MKTAFVRFTYLALASTLLITACGDSRQDVGADVLDGLKEGTSRDSVLAVMGNGPLTAQFADTLRVVRGFRTESYLIDGKQYEVLYYRELQGNVIEPVQQERETPIVLQNGKMLGWGWKYYVKTGMEELRLPSPLARPVDPNAPGVNRGALPPAPAAPDSAAANADTTKKGGV